MSLAPKQLIWRERYGYWCRALYHPTPHIPVTTRRLVTDRLRKVNRQSPSLSKFYGQHVSIITFYSNLYTGTSLTAKTPILLQLKGYGHNHKNTRDDQKGEDGSCNAKKPQMQTNVAKAQNSVFACVVIIWQLGRGAGSSPPKALLTLLNFRIFYRITK